VLYGGGGGRKALSPRRLAALVQGALGSVGKAEGGSFVDLDAIGGSGSGGSGGGDGEGSSPRELARLLLSSEGAATSLWRVLEPELLGAADLLARQATRRAATAAWGQLPRPRLPFLGVLGPAPQDVRGPLFVPAPATALAALGAAAAAAASAVAAPPTAAAAAGGLPRLAWASPADVLDALCPPLSRDEELFALSLVDAGSDLLGPDAAVLLRGEATLPLSPQDAAVTLRALLDAAALATAPATATTATTDTEAAADSAPASFGLSSVLAALAALLPAPAASPSHSSGAAGQLRDAASLYADLPPAEAQRARDLASRLAQGLIAKMEARLQVL
jgi:hypothetical protein